MTLRRQFNPLPQDLEFLEEYGLPWETIIEGSAWVLLHEFPTPAGYTQPRVTAAIRIETGIRKPPSTWFTSLPRSRGKTAKGSGRRMPCNSLTGRPFNVGRDTAPGKIPGSPGGII